MLLAAFKFFCTPVGKPVSKTSTTLAPHQVVAVDYAGIFYPGGGGQFYDVVQDDRIASIAATIFENGGLVGAAGHGAV